MSQNNNEDQQAVDGNQQTVQQSEQAARARNLHPQALQEEPPNASGSTSPQRKRYYTYSSETYSEGETDDEEEELDSYHQRKRPRFDNYPYPHIPMMHNVDATFNSDFIQMKQQLQFLSNVVNSTLTTPSLAIPSTSGTTPVMPMNFLTMPAPIETRTLEFGEVETSVDEKRVLPLASDARLKIINNLQRFGSNAWKEVRYASALKSFLAFPGFTDLKVNEELCYLEKGKDFIAPTERALAGLSNAILEHRELLRNTLQSIVDWTSTNPKDLNSQSIFEKLNLSFGMNSQIMKNYEQILQIICGKRSECIEARRERLITELPNKNLKSALRKLPPSSEYLFARENLSSLMQSLGGPQVWLNTPSYITAKRSSSHRSDQNSSKAYNRTQYRSNNSKKFYTQKDDQTQRPNNNKGNRNFQKKDQPKPKSDESFRKKQEK